ncbi:helix-turn-helix domain-containing protein [Amycolatopsis lurida]
MDGTPETGDRIDHTGNGAGRSVLEGAFLLLDELTRTGEAGPTQLAADTGLPKATAHRLLDQLAAVGAVQRAAGRYRIGTRMFRLGQAWEPLTALRAAARDPLRQLAAVARFANVALAVPESGRSMVIGGIRGELDQIRPWRAGTLLPHGCAVDIVSATCAPGAPRPERYSTTEWKRLIAAAAERGVAFDHTRSEPWRASCLGAPVHAPSGQVIAAVAVAVFDSHRLAAIGPAAQRAANMISANLARSAGSAFRPA